MSELKEDLVSLKTKITKPLLLKEYHECKNLLEIVFTSLLIIDYELDWDDKYEIQNFLVSSILFDFDETAHPQGINHMS